MPPDADQRARVEAEIRDLHERGAHRAAASRALEFYGGEILAFLVALHDHSRDEADDVFSSFAEGFWRTFASFAWQCSARTWMYRIARRASLEHWRKEGRRRQRIARLPTDAQLSQLVVRVRTATAAHLRTENKDRVAELRRSLPADDQTLLMLRVDRGLTWKELARVMRAEADAAPLSGHDLDREAARLRKRFQVIKERLYDLARREGLIS